ncbi:hypothetical protein LVJ94_38000 [Pendulispora rubella]|uniref:Uncharacterized protein n=1 Tax=Pendulispora rubella TaxID=2741070 RepID=A0ABZ2KVI3_9BACT
MRALLAVVALTLMGCPNKASDPAPDSAPSPAAGKATDASERGDVIRAYLQVDPARVTREKLAALGVEVDTVAGDIMTARIPAGALDRVRATDGVLHVEIARPVYPRSDAGAIDPSKDGGKRD